MGNISLPFMTQAAQGAVMFTGSFDVRPLSYLGNRKSLRTIYSPWIGKEGSVGADLKSTVRNTPTNAHARSNLGIEDLGLKVSVS